MRIQNRPQFDIRNIIILLFIIHIIITYLIQNVGRYNRMRCRLSPSNKRIGTIANCTF